MSRRTTAARLVGFAGRKSAVDCDLDEEIRAHVELQTQENIEAGMTAEEARRQALLAFGNTTAARETSVAMWTFPAIESLLEDLLYSIRLLRKAPGFAAAAITVLALGIGGNTAVVSITYANLLRSLPVPQPAELASITFTDSTNTYALSIPLFEDLRRRQQSFTDVMAWHTLELELRGRSRAQPVHSALASGNAFTVLGILPYLGRALTPEDDRRGGGPGGWAAMISHSFWQSHFHGDESILGKTIVLENLTCKVVGVAPPGFDGLYVGEHTEVILPLSARYALNPNPPTADDATYTVLGRLKPGVTLAKARAEIEALSPSIIRDNDANHLLSIGYVSKFHMSVESGGRRSSFLLDISQPLRLLQVLVAIILLICCANVAGLLAARVLSRRQELVTRRALGASKARLLRQLFIETLVLCSGGAVVGVLFALWITPLLAYALLPGAADRRMHLLPTIDGAPIVAVLLISIAVTAATSILVAIGPVLRVAKWKLVNEANPGLSSRHNSWIIPAQVAFSALVLVAAGMALITVYRLLHINPGFRTHDVLTVPTDLHLRPETEDQAVALYEGIVDRLRHAPGIESASMAAIQLLAGGNTSSRAGSILPDGSLRTDPALQFNEIGSEYFRTVGTPVIAGREFADSDKSAKATRCMLSRSAAEFFFPQGNALGSHLKRFATGTISDLCEVIGVVADIKHGTLRDENLRMIYWTPGNGFPLIRGNRVLLVLRTTNFALANESVRRVLSTMVPGAPLLEPIPMDDQLRESIRRERMNAWMAGAFGTLALLLTAVGLYGTVRYRVGQRTGEIAVRIAIGAQRSSMLRMILKSALRMTLIGLVIGTIASLATARIAASLLNSLKFEPIAVVGMATALLFVALVASYFPARRATKVDPMLALRSE